MILFVSPHLDDAAFSAGALIARLAREHPVVVATVFTRSVPDPTGFALACQTDKGLGPDVDYMALRREEDRQALTRLGARPAWLDLPEAPHRGYSDATALFGPLRCGDDPVQIKRALGPLVAQANVVFGPLAHGGHVDHRLVLAAVTSLTDAALWLDMPYALRHPLDDVKGLRVFTATPSEIEIKINACAAYRSQLDFQFGGETAMRAALADLPERFALPAAVAPRARIEALLFPEMAEKS